MSVQTLKDWEKANKSMLSPPPIAWLTVALFVACCIVFIGAVILALNGTVAYWQAMLAIAVAQYGLFTVMHEASHRALSQHPSINETLGNISCFLLSPVAGIQIFRFIHMQHHRFTNEDISKDPDHWCGLGPKILLPLHWLSLDLNYIVWYLPRWNTRPWRERKEIVIAASLFVVIAAGLLIFGYWQALLFLWLIPSRIAVFFLALAFDYLPHQPYEVKQSDDPYRATAVRPHYSSILTPVFLGQNYHLIHHLYPRAPFYRYRRIWNKTHAMLDDKGAKKLSWMNQEIK